MLAKHSPASSSSSVLHARERCPLTIGGYDREKGTITIIFQRAGLTTMALAAMEEGDWA